MRFFPSQVLSVGQAHRLPLWLLLSVLLLWPTASAQAQPTVQTVRAAGQTQPLTTLAQVPAGLQAADWASIRALYAASAASQGAYLKASNPGVSDSFGRVVAVSGDTVVVGATGEASNATGVNGDGSNNSASSAGAAYVFVRSSGVWSQQAYLKASNTAASDSFGHAVAIDGDTVVVGAYGEDSNATGVNGDGSNNSASVAGAAYVFVRSSGVWSQQAYLKASNSAAGDSFGYAVAVAGDTVVVGAYQEASNATGVNGDGSNNSAGGAGAVYVFGRASGVWSQQAYLKASNPGANDNFGYAVAMAGDTLVVGAYQEDSNATGVNGDGSGNSADGAGAAYVFVRASGVWSQQAYLKASNSAASDQFGGAVAVAGDTVVVGATGEDSNATGVNGDESNNDASGAGATYIFVRTSGVWSQGAYLKASNSAASDNFGYAVAVAGDTVVVGAYAEDSNATGVNGDSSNNSASGAGAAYVFGRAGGVWRQGAYLKASNPEANDNFGFALALAGDTLVVGAYSEDSNATGVNGDGSNNSISGAGAAYLFTLLPDMAVTGNGLVIASGANTPILADHTAFGPVAVGGGLTRTLTISNTGSTALALSGTPAITLSDTTHFSVTVSPAITVGTGLSTTFQLRFDPATSGSFTTTVTIANNDPDENPYTFVIGGIGVEQTTSSVTSQGTPSTLYVANPHATYAAQSVAGVYTITATFRNTIDPAVDLAETYFQVKQINHVNGNNYLLNADAGPGQVGAKLSIANSALPGGDRWSQGEDLTVDFVIGLTERRAFTFKVDLFAVSTVVAGASAPTPAYLTSFTFTVDPTQAVPAAGQPIFLPLIHQ